MIAASVVGWVILLAGATLAAVAIVACVAHAIRRAR